MDRQIWCLGCTADLLNSHQVIYHCADGLQISRKRLHTPTCCKFPVYFKVREGRWQQEEQQMHYIFA